MTERFRVDFIAGASLLCYKLEGRELVHNV